MEVNVSLVIKSHLYDIRNLSLSGDVDQVAIRVKIVSKLVSLYFGKEDATISDDDLDKICAWAEADYYQVA